MKAVITIAILCATFFVSCRKRNYLHFTDKQLVFVNYAKDQQLQFFDTTSALQTLVQQRYQRQFHEQVGIYGKTGELTEEYEVLYRAENNGSLGFQIEVDVLSSSLTLEIDSYRNHITLNPTHFSLRFHL